MAESWFHERYASDSVLTSGAMWGTTVALGWMVVQYAYYSFFHPLSKYPGPKLAGVTTWWKTYIELVKQESLAHKLIKLHAQYGGCSNMVTPLRV